MLRRNIQTVILAVLTCHLCLFPVIGQSENTYIDTKKILGEMHDQVINNDRLAELFKLGDQRMPDLIKALNDPDPDISLRAQIIIRYLGNDNGMTALLEWYKRQEKYQVAGPVPLPLRDWDYCILGAQYLDREPTKWVNADRYIYALALDGSLRAKETLEKMVKIATENDDSSIAFWAAKRVQSDGMQTPVMSTKGLAKLVLNHAFFISAVDRKHATARLLAFNTSKNKALIEIRVGRGVLSEEWFHVVVQKNGDGWRFYSVSEVATS